MYLSRRALYKNAVQGCCTSRTFTAAAFPPWTVRQSPEVLRALCDHAVVAARSQLLGFRNRERMPVAETKLAVVCAGHSKIV